MLIKEYKLTKKEVDYLLAMPCETDEAIRFVTKLRVDLEKNKPGFDQLHGRWLPLVWFASQERIMPVDEMLAALSRQAGHKKPGPKKEES